MGRRQGTNLEWERCAFNAVCAGDLPRVVAKWYAQALTTPPPDDFSGRRAVERARARIGEAVAERWPEGSRPDDPFLSLLRELLGATPPADPISAWKRLALRHPEGEEEKGERQAEIDQAFEGIHPAIGQLPR